MTKKIEPNEKTNLVLRIGNKIPFSGLICAVCTGLSFTIGKLLIKHNKTLHPTVMVSIRGFVILIFYGTIIVSKRLSITGDSLRQFFFLSGRGFTGFLVSITSYTALWCIPLGDAITLLLTATIFTSIFARIFLGERFTLVNLFCIIFTMVGVVCIAEPPLIFGSTEEEANQYKNKLLGVILSLVGAISFACSYVILRHLKGVHVDLIVTYFGIFTAFGTLLCLPFIKHFGDNPETIKLPEETAEWIYTIAIAVCGLLGEFFLTCAFQLEEANYIAILRCGDIVMAFVIEALFLPGEMKSTHWNTFLGCGVILSCVILSTVSKIFKERYSNSNDEDDSLKKEEIIPYEQKC